LAAPQPPAGFRGWIVAPNDPCTCEPLIMAAPRASRVTGPHGLTGCVTKSCLL